MASLVHTGAGPGHGPFEEEKDWVHSQNQAKEQPRWYDVPGKPLRVFQAFIP